MKENLLLYTRGEMKVFLSVYSICRFVHVTVQKHFFLSYRGLPKAHASKSRHQIHDHDGDLHLCDVNSVQKVAGKSEISFCLSKKKSSAV